MHTLPSGELAQLRPSAQVSTISSGSSPPVPQPLEQVGEAQVLRATPSSDAVVACRFVKAAELAVPGSSVQLGPPCAYSDCRHNHGKRRAQGCGGMPGIRLQAFRGSAEGARAGGRQMISRSKLIGGMKLHWSERGEGSPIVVLHGLQDTERTWARVADELAASHRVFALDSARLWTVWQTRRQLFTRLASQGRRGLAGRASSAEPRYRGALVRRRLVAVGCCCIALASSGVWR